MSFFAGKSEIKMDRQDPKPATEKSATEKSATEKSVKEAHPVGRGKSSPPMGLVYPLCQLNVEILRSRCLVREPGLGRPTCSLLCGKEPKAEKAAVTAVVEKVEDPDLGYEDLGSQTVLKLPKCSGNCSEPHQCPFHHQNHKKNEEGIQPRTTCLVHSL